MDGYSTLWRLEIQVLNYFTSFGELKLWQHSHVAITCRSLHSSGLSRCLFVKHGSKPVHSCRLLTRDSTKRGGLVGVQKNVM
jgi:hypothetical protein